MQLKVLRVLQSLCTIVSIHVTPHQFLPTHIDQRPPVKYRWHFIAFVYRLGIKQYTDEDDLTASYTSRNKTGTERIFWRKEDPGVFIVLPPRQLSLRPLAWEELCVAGACAASEASQTKLHGNTMQWLCYASETMRWDIVLKGKEKYPTPAFCLGLHPVLTLLLAAVTMNGTNQFQEISTPSIMSHAVTSFLLTSRASCWHLWSSSTTNWY